MARERSLDLVEISPNATPPVCKIQDYGKYLYEKDKSDRAARKTQKVIVIKEVKFSVTVDEHDYQTKKNQAVRFLGDGDKVKASLRFKGRQMAHRDLGYKIINRLIHGYRRRGHGGVHAAHGRHDAARDPGSVQEGRGAAATCGTEGEDRISGAGCVTKNAETARRPLKEQIKQSIYARKPLK